MNGKIENNLDEKRWQDIVAREEEVMLENDGRIFNGREENGGWNVWSAQIFGFISTALLV